MFSTHNNKINQRILFHRRRVELTEGYSLDRKVEIAFKLGNKSINQHF